MPMILKMNRLTNIIYVCFLILVFSYLMAPVPIVILASISKTSYLTFPPEGITLKWYGKALSHVDYINGIKYSLMLAIITVSISIIIGLPISYIIVRYQFPGKSILETLILSPLIIPVIVIGICLLNFFTKIGIQDTFLRLILGHVIIAFPYAVRTISASLYKVDKTLEEASQTLGASRFKAFIKITLPLIKPGIIAGAIFAFVISFDNVPVSIFLVGSRIITLPVVIFNSAEYGIDPSVAAISSILVAFTFLTIVIIEKYLGFATIIGTEGSRNV